MPFLMTKSRRPTTAYSYLYAPQLVITFALKHFIATLLSEVRPVSRPVPFQTQKAAVNIGEHLSAWRKLRGMTAQQVAERAGTTRQSVARLERGDPSVGLEIFLNVCRALGILDAVVTSTDPYETPFGRARADQALPQRVRR